MHASNFQPLWRSRSPNVVLGTRIRVAATQRTTYVDRAKHIVALPLTMCCRQRPLVSRMCVHRDCSCDDATRAVHRPVSVQLLDRRRRAKPYLQLDFNSRSPIRCCVRVRIKNTECVSSLSVSPISSSSSRVLSALVCLRVYIDP